MIEIKKAAARFDFRCGPQISVGCGGKHREDANLTPPRKDCNLFFKPRSKKTEVIGILAEPFACALQIRAGEPKEGR